MPSFVSRATLPLFGFTLFLSAALLFLIQLIYARLVLPLLGGSAAVWSTAMVFYQAVLLAGYGYAHLVSTRLPLRRQLGLQAAILALPALVLPLAVPAGWLPPANSNPIPWLLALLAAGAGAPFFAVSTISPLLQKWFATTPHPQAQDPYFLYSASNCGSLLGLLAYPFLIEPNTSLFLQSRLWSWGFAGLSMLVLAAGFTACRSAQPATSPRRAAARSAAPSARQRTGWVLFALVPSSLMLSVTNYVSSEIAAVPLLWVIPLALYLGTFIHAFARHALVPLPLAQRWLPISLVPVVMAISTGATTPVLLLTAAHLVCLTLAALVLHGELAAIRPNQDHLTEFYFWVAIGGVLGGVFNALLAPLLFRGIFEYHLGLLAAACLGLPPQPPSSARERRLDFLLPLGLALLVLILLFTLGRGPATGEPEPFRALLVFGVPVLLAFLMSRRRVRFTLALAVILLLSSFFKPGVPAAIHTERSFFGVHRVARDSSGRFVQLIHGRTLHGIQSLDPRMRKIPLSYYHPSGPLGQLFRAFGDQLRGPVAGVGLGAGAIAAYGRPGQELTFFEIDPVVKRLASDPRYFTYLADSPAQIRVELGDARLSLQAAPDAHFQLLVLDAYSSDSIPVHLLTREALQLYLRKLQPGGLLAFHISNLHLDLGPVMGALARDAGLVCLEQRDTALNEEERTSGKSPSRWVVLARTQDDVAKLAQSGRWQPNPGSPASRVWTDDYSSVLRVLDLGLH